MTHFSNLPSIIEEGLICPSELKRRGLSPINIGYLSLKDRRATTKVQTTLGGTLDDYIPFYFAERSPMIVAIAKGNVDDYKGPQREIIYLVSSIRKALEFGGNWCFTDGHAAEAISRFYDTPEELELIDHLLDWSAIRSWDWRPKEGDTDRKRKKQAEFLIHQQYPWESIESIEVMDSEMRVYVQRIIQELRTRHIPTINITRTGYYNPKKIGYD